MSAAAVSSTKADNMFTEIVDSVRAEFNSGVTFPIQFRVEQLKSVLKLFSNHRQEILDALYKDMRKGAYEGSNGDITTIETDVKILLKYLKKLVGNDYLPFNVFGSLDKAWIRKEPYGVVLIIGTWNYPFQTALQPLVGAIAAGNCAIIKPSEVTPTCADLIAKLLPMYLPEQCYRVITGDATVAQDLLKNRFDYIFFTGAPNVGRIVHKAATEYLTPVTLELGGKNPCFIDPSANFTLAAKRILWGKLINNGQICIAPDYVLCTAEAVVEFVRVAKQVLVEWYGKDMQKTTDIIRVVNQKHFRRLEKLLQCTRGDVAVGGQTDETDLWIEPTIIVNVDPYHDALMEEEIFGPILPIVIIKNADDAIQIIRSKPKPLAMYIFSGKDEITNKVMERTSSGNVCVNDVFWSGVWLGLPFGGVGESGMGRFHGKFSFDTFSHKRAVLQRGMGYISEKFGEPRYPPYLEWKGQFFSLLIQYFDAVNIDVPKVFSYIIVFALGLLVAFGISYGLQA